MTIGTSDGETFESEYHSFAGKPMISAGADTQVGKSSSGINTYFPQSDERYVKERQGVPEPPPRQSIKDIQPPSLEIDSFKSRFGDEPTTPVQPGMYLPTYEGEGSFRDPETGIRYQRVSEFAGQKYAQSSPLYKNPGYSLGSERTGRSGHAADYQELDIGGTKLTPAEEEKFQDWRKKYAPGDSGEDYDLRGAFKEGLTPDERGHMSDKFKKPLHPTFSEESIYHGAPTNRLTKEGFVKDIQEGGRWEKNDDGSFNFYPGRTNLHLHGPRGLRDYFDKYEKGNKLILPQSDVSPDLPIAGQQYAMMDEEVKGGKVVRPDFGGPSGKTGGGPTGEVVNIKGQFEQKKVYNAIQEIDKGRGPELMKRDPELYRQAVKEKQANYKAEVRQKKEDAIYDVLKFPGQYSKGTIQEVQRNFPEEFKGAYARIVKERQAKGGGKEIKDPYQDAVNEQVWDRLVKQDKQIELKNKYEIKDDNLIVLHKNDVKKLNPGFKNFLNWLGIED
jgi:hypothetical protein